jgi:hypothetical protein
VAKHYHLIIETPEGNLSGAMQSLTVSYSTWFTRRHRRNGHFSGAATRRDVRLIEQQMLNVEM